MLKAGDREKVVALTEGDQSKLHSDIDPDQLPRFLGGTKSTNQVWPPVIENNGKELSTKSDQIKLELIEFLWPCDLTPEDLTRLQDAKKKVKKQAENNVGGVLFDQQKHDIISRFQKLVFICNINKNLGTSKTTMKEQPKDRYIKILQQKKQWQ